MSGPGIGRTMSSLSNGTDDSKIQGGLGSLNRWSQSTTSSKGSPKYSGLESQAAEKPTKSITPMQESQTLSHVGTNNRMEVPMLGPPGTGALSSFSSGIMDTANIHSNYASPGSVPANSDLPPPSGFSGDLIAEDSHLSSDREKAHEKRRRGHSQKAMLSKALQKANTAVLLDNAANFEGAMEAYNDACQLLQLVMLRSNGGEDEKLKLQEIRDTYMIRVTELQRMDFSIQENDSKALPERPLSQESYGDPFHPVGDIDDAVSTGDKSQFKTANDPLASEEPRVMSTEQITPRRHSLISSALDGIPRHDNSSRVTTQGDGTLPTSLGYSGKGLSISSDANNASEALNASEIDAHNSRYSRLSLLSNHARDIYESTSWLDTIDESGASSPASMRSKASSVYLRHRSSRRFSRGTEAEFDAALDAAVEAAYDEGLEPAVNSGSPGNKNDDDVVANARRNVELAKQKVREAEREAEVAMARGRDIRHLQHQTTLSHTQTDDFDEEAEEEERLLEEMTRGYIMDEFEFDIQSKSALPRQSDSSSFSGKTWESSVASNTTAGAALSPLAEDDGPPLEGGQQHILASSKLAPETPPAVTESSQRPPSVPSVRARRMSGQNSTELKIETYHRAKASLDASASGQEQPSGSYRPQPLPKDEPQTSIHIFADRGSQMGIHPTNRDASIGSFSENVTPSGIDDPKVQGYGNISSPKIPSPAHPIGKVPSAPDNLDKPNSHLKSFRMRNASVPAPDLATDSPGSPASSAFPTLDIQRGVTSIGPVLPTPTGAHFASNGMPSDEMYLFDSHIHSPTSPGSPNLMASNAPLPLEPCPESFLLRPFWLMRCIYQSIAHPRGGYLSTKLFIPRDVWRVKNVKIKAIDEKVSNCDLLTAALLKLAKVDTYDADAVLEEMQSLESVLDQVQTSLSKKIGGEVGVQGALPLFRASQTSDDTSTIENIPTKVSNGTSKSYLTSWRKLRSKNSGLGAAPPLANSKDTGKDNLTISSLPMTSTPTSQPTRLDTARLQLNGPNANYMGALARLCDAAQVLDQIAQQVEDPGLRHSSPTLVGLELSTRHAAEFFGFYVCRFALNDIGMMLDKFIKRGSEWVLI